MKKNRFRIAALILGIALVVWLGATPSGRRSTEWIQSRLGASAMGDPSRYEITVELYSPEADDTMEFVWYVSQREYMDADFFPRKISEKYVDMAKKQLAKKRGYYSDLYGDDASRIEQFKVGRIILTDTQTDRKKLVSRT